MRSNSRSLFALVAGAALALTLAACGGDETSGTAGDYPPPTEAPSDAQEGGELEVIASDDIDYMDPGVAFYQFTYMVTSAGHRTLLAFKPDDSQEPSPDLAEGEPEVSEDERTITFTIRDGVRFSPPVDREVTAADVEYAIERALLPGVGNGYAPVYLAEITGFDDAQKEAEDDPTGGAPDIEGVTAVDDRTLEFKLDRPSLTFIQALSLPISAPVPEEYAREFDVENPSTYGQYVAFTGPYMVENDRETGELTGYTPGREIQMVRNPNWDPETDYRPAYLDSVQIQEGFDDTASASRKILDGSGQVNGDITPPPTVIQEADERISDGDLDDDQMTLTPSGGNRYIALNTQEPPFDDLNVRRAVLAASDRLALRNTRGGELVGPVATHYIPPEIPGFEEAGGLDPPEDADFLASETGDPDLAAEYMREAGFDSGQCEGDCEVTMVGDAASPDRETTEVFEGVLEDLGFEVTTRHVNRDVMYTRFCNAPEQTPNVCPSVGWLKDFTDPQSILEPTFSGDAINSTSNYNWPLLDDPKINKAIEKAVPIADLEERAQAWGEIDQMITEQAPAVPYVWDNQINIQSSDVAGVIHTFNANWDLSFTSLEE